MNMFKLSRYKKILIASMFILISFFMMSCTRRDDEYFYRNNIKTVSMIKGQDFLIYKEKQFHKTFLKGVNLGAAKPNTWPGELAITKDEYLRWFSYISLMNANSIRVYTTMMPEFYEALYIHNLNNENPLYLLQGVWLNENKIAEIKDPYSNNQEIKNEFINDAKDLIDIFHGNKTLDSRPGFASGTYSFDISKYVIGWILGIEWDPSFVENTNLNNQDKNSYQGSYISINNSNAFEVFLAEVGDQILAYEIINYKMTRPISFTNWLTTDFLEHLGEPDPKEDMVSVDTEQLKLSRKAFAGIFASYHIYPYYPEFMNYDPKYIDSDPTKINTYKRYLEDLISAHHMPVLVAEFGVPSSRGKAHENPHSGFNQGRLTEIEQGNIVKSMLNDIYQSNAIGALIFAFQDEWFKRTWNTMDLDLEWRRPYWSNVETNEQMFGLLTFEPGEFELPIKLDGIISDWDHIDLVHQFDGLKIKTTHDVRYLYILIEANQLIEDKDIMIPIVTINNQGNRFNLDTNHQFNEEVDFLIQINSNKDSRILVDSYYNPFEHLYGTILKMINVETKTKNSGKFSEIRHALSRELKLPLSNEIIPFQSYEAGYLIHGISDYNNVNYNSLSDYYVKDHIIEIRIPWLLLNFMDPSTKQIMSDFNNQLEFTSENFTNFKIGAFYKDKTYDSITFGEYNYESWQFAIYHERLKQSYFIIQEAFSKITN
jgi:hypothetical protein